MCSLVGAPHAGPHTQQLMQAAARNAVGENRALPYAAAATYEEKTERMYMSHSSTKIYSRVLRLYHRLFESPFLLNRRQPE